MPTTPHHTKGTPSKTFIRHATPRYAREADMIVVTAGPTGTVTITVPPDPRAHQLLGAFAAARRTGDGQYALPEAQLDALTRHAQRAGWVVTDRRGVASTGTKERTGNELGPLPECQHCGQPARRFYPDSNRPYPPPKHCPGCGLPWDAVVVQVTGADLHVSQTCPGCGHEQRGTFPNCAQCGTLIPPAPTLEPVVPRTRLDDPMTLADAIGEYLDTVPDADDQSQAAINARGRAKVRQALLEAKAAREAKP